MPNGDDMIRDFNIEDKISEYKEKGELDVFIARQVYELNNRCPLHDKRIRDLEDGSKVVSGITGGITGALTSAMVAIINYLK